MGAGSDLCNDLKRPVSILYPPSDFEMRSRGGKRRNKHIFDCVEHFGLGPQLLRSTKRKLIRCDLALTAIRQRICVSLLLR